MLKIIQLKRNVDCTKQLSNT